MRFWLTLFLLIGSAGTGMVPVAAQDNVSLEGQVVCCAECWGEADRTKVEYGTAANLLKAISCVEHGDPTLLAVREQDQFTLYELATGRFRLPGKNWLEFVGKRVSVSGKIERGKPTVFRVDSLKVLSPSLAEQDAAKVIGTEVELKLTDFAGVAQSLGQLKGRVVVLNFWATYCIPCKTEMPDLAAIQAQFAPFGVQVIGASTDADEDRGKVLQFVRETKINFPIWMGATTADMIRFGLGGALPGTIIVGKDGKVARVISGVIDQAALRKQIDALIALPSLAESPRQTKEVARKDQQVSEASSVPS
jgi:thiol-disulfide isomerase/thioredoxin